MLRRSVRKIQFVMANIKNSLWTEPLNYDTSILQWMQLKPAGNSILPIDKFCSNWHTNNSLDKARSNAANFPARHYIKYLCNFRVCISVVQNKWFLARMTVWINIRNGFNRLSQSPKGLFPFERFSEILFTQGFVLTGIVT